MKVVWLAPGNSIHTKRWVRALRSRGIDVYLLSQHVDPDWCDGTPVTWLPYRGVAGYVRNVPTVRRALREIRPDLLNVHYASGYGTLSALVGFRPTVLSVWGADVYDFPTDSWKKRALLRWNLGRVTAIASTSRAMAEQVRRVAPRLAAPIAITPFGVDTDTFAPDPDLRDPRFINVGTVKSLTPKYGIDTLIRAFAKVRTDERIDRAGWKSRLRLTIVGGGPQQSELESLAATLGVAECTRFVGAVAHELVPTWLNQLDIYVAPSRFDSESFGVAVVEASSCGLPVVVSDAGGLPEVVHNGETGFVVPRDDPDALADRLVRLVTEPELRFVLGQAGRREVCTRYRWDECVDTMVNLYRDVLAGALTGAEFS